ncbi:OmpH family outer membrane protein [Marimonas arenosa]|uniref:OmpH family outer membrane protein n=1 Tax=Marimonas arenosa TaxID=1795305 RepID=A0AAE3WBC6_9RHOB|nr:OmpH family outer membrane protein [Marimonas arenosa]MDQ2088513.1 OmpH family outer membrane protein [Marimonas arenosa]
MTVRALGRVQAAAAGLLALCLSFVPLSLASQQLGLPTTNIVVIDTNQLFAESAFGQRVKNEIEADSRALAAENRRIEAELAAEEKALTEERAGMTPQAFRDKADAFDAKVRRTREEQEAKALALAEESDKAQRRFLTVAQPVLEELMAETGAALLLDQRAVLLSVQEINITDVAVRRIDRAIGDGSAIVPQAPDPDPEPGDPGQD